LSLPAVSLARNMTRRGEETGTKWTDEGGT
jgi:hypothetical protein